MARPDDLTMLNWELKFGNTLGDNQITEIAYDLLPCLSFPVIAFQHCILEALIC